MDGLRTIGYVTPIAVAVIAVVLARRDRTHFAFAVAAVWLSATDWVRIGLSTLRAGATRPYGGLALVSARLDQLLILSWSFATVALALHYFTRIRALWLVVPYAIAFALCLVPEMRGESLVLLYRTVSTASCITAWCAIGWAMLFRDELRPTVSHLLVMFWAAADVIINAVPFASGFFRDWDMVRMANIVTAMACIVAQAWQLTRPAAAESKA